MPALLDAPPCVRQSYPEPIFPPRRRRSLIRSAPGFLRRTLLMVVSTAAIYGFVSSGVRPYVQAHRLNEQAIQMERQIAAAQQTQAELTRRVAELQTPVGEQSAARTYGWLLPGEISIACPRPTSRLSQTSDAVLTTPPARTGPGLLEQIGHLLEW